MAKKLINIAILPARIGSKRIKRKNIKFFYGKPMLTWTFKILTESKLFDKIIVSSESDIVLKLAKKIGCHGIIKRPRKLADNITGTQEVIKHAIKELEKDYFFDNVCCVYPCNPFIQIKDLKRSFNILKKNKDKLILPVTNYSHPIERAYIFKNKNEIKFINNFFSKVRTQDLKVKFHDTGQFYFASKKSWFNSKINKIGLKIPNWRVVDIDNIKDWGRAEVLFRFFKKNKFLKMN